MSFAKILLFLSIASNITATSYYIYSIYRIRIKPHAFTFIIWSIELGINLAVQTFSGVGWGAILLATNFLGCLIVFLYCIKKGYIQYDKLDWLCLILGLLAIALWFITKHPIYSVILSCIIDFFAFLPSFRKSFRKPFEDSALLFFVAGLEYLMTFPSYKVYSFLVLAYPIVVLCLDLSYACMISIRRFQLKNN